MPKFEYEDSEIQDILKRAIALDATRIVRQDTLERTAAELGISPEALAEAERAHVLEREQQLEMQEFKRHFQRPFYEHLASYLVVNTFLVAINLFTTHSGKIWAIFPILGWGIGIAMHAFTTFFPNSSEFEKEYAKWKKKKRKASSSQSLS